MTDAGTEGRGADRPERDTLTRVAFSGNAADWDDLGSRFCDFTINQSWAWAEGRRADGWSVSRDVWTDSEGEAVALATALRIRWNGLRVLYLSRGPVVFRDGATIEDAEALFTACVADYRATLRLGELFVCHVYQSSAQVSPAALRASGLLPLFPSSSDYNLSSLIHLRERDAVVQGASSDWRKLFRRSSALLDSVKTSDNVRMFLQARDLVSELEMTKGFSTSLTPALVTAVSRARARLFYLETESGRMMAALIVALCGRRASRFLAGVAADDSRRHPGIGRVLEVAGSRWAYDSGATHYDVEGINPCHPGVSDFKKGMRGEPFAPAGPHIASRPAFLARAASIVKRRPWRQAWDIWRTSKVYFGQLYLRRLTGGRLGWERLRLYRRSLEERIPIEDSPGYSFVLLDRFDRDEFGYRLSTVRHLWARAQELTPGSLELLVITDRYGLTAAYAFLAWGRSDVPELDDELRLEKDEVYINDCVVLREHRGRRLYTYMLDRACSLLKRRDVRSALIAAHPANVPSCRGIERSGFVVDCEAHHLKIGPWRSLRWRTMGRRP